MMISIALRRHLKLLSLLGLIAVGRQTFAVEGATPIAPVAWGDQNWRLQIDPASGALVHIENATDPRHMNWLREAGRWDRRNWMPTTAPSAVSSDGQWGLVQTTHTGLLHAAEVRRLSDLVWEATYTSAVLTVVVRREIDASGNLVESYTFQNTGIVALNLPLGSVQISAPFFDQYPDAKISLDSRCHTHVWMGGSCAWINAMRMGTQAPHLGFLMMQGSLDAYSQCGGTLSDRGVFLLHPAAMKIAPGKSQTISWKLFWHTGWDDFFAKLQATDGFIRLTAKDYVVQAGQPIEIAAESAGSLQSAKVLANGKPIETHIDGNHLTASVPSTEPGEVLVQINNGSRKTWLRANLIPPVDALIDARVRFIVKHQQRIAPGDPLNGAFVSYDNETGKQVVDNFNDHNPARERTAMGVLCAQYLPLCTESAFKAELLQSLTRYSDFVARELEDEQGVVYNQPTRKGNWREYNVPWIAQFHLVMYRATGDVSQLDRFVRVLKTYYAAGGQKHYGIGLPIYDGLKELDEAGRSQDKADLLADFKAHANFIRDTGFNYPRFEVNYEQSIVAPAVQLLAEMYDVTGDPSYLDGAKMQMPMLEAFCGKQPDSRLYEVAIRHWDDYWFGKINIYGDTFPHYWSTLNATTYAYYGLATKDPAWLQRADTVLKANLSLFNPDGSASCAHLYPFTSNGQRGGQNDPWANDQDWALVNLLTVRALNAKNSVQH